MMGFIGRLAGPAIAAVGLSILAGPAGAAPGDRLGHAAGLLDPGALIYVEVADPGALLDRAMSERVRGALGAIPGVAEALDRPDLRQLRQAAEFVAGRLGTTWEEGLRTLAGGGIVAAVEEADPPRLVLVVTPTDAAFLDRAHATLLELARADARGKGRPDPVAEFEHRGVIGYALPDQGSYAILDGRLVFSSGRDGLARAIDRHLDGEGGLSESPVFLDRRPDAEHLAWAYARVDRLRELDPGRFAGDEPDAGAMLLLGAWIDLVRKAPWASATLDWADDRLAASLTLAAPEGGRPEPMARFLPPEGEGAPPPIKVDGLLATINLWRDQEALWQVREELLPPEALQNLAQLDSFAGTFFGGREFGDSVLAPLGEHWQLVAALQDYEGMEPRPEVKLPAFALVVDLDPGRPEFAQRLRVAFQSFLGLVNLGAAETGAPPLMLGSETHDGVPISLASFMPAAGAVGEEAPDEPAEVHYRHNFTPSVAEVGGRFILSSSVGLTRSLIDALRADPEPGPTGETLLMTADGPALAGLLDLNRERLVLRNMLEQGNDRDAAEREVAVLSALLRYLGAGTLRLDDEADRSTLSLEFLLGGVD